MPPRPDEPGGLFISQLGPAPSIVWLPGQGRINKRELGYQQHRESRAALSPNPFSYPRETRWTMRWCLKQAGRVALTFASPSRSTAPCLCGPKRRPSRSMPQQALESGQEKFLKNDFHCALFRPVAPLVTLLVGTVHIPRRITSLSSVELYQKSVSIARALVTHHPHRHGAIGVGGAVTGSWEQKECFKPLAVVACLAGWLGVPRA